MRPLEARKQLLIAESEVNRARLIEEWHTTADAARTLRVRSCSITSLTVGAAALLAGLTSFRRPHSAASGRSLSWLQTLLDGARLGASLWSEFRSRKK